MMTLIDQMNRRAAVLEDLRSRMREAEAAYHAAKYRYAEVYHRGLCYRCLGDGTVGDRDFGPPSTCPVCNGTKRWPPEEAGE